MEKEQKKATKEKLKPKLFSVLKNYSAQQFAMDVISGIIVAIIAITQNVLTRRKEVQQ